MPIAARTPRQRPESANKMQTAITAKGFFNKSRALPRLTTRCPAPANHSPHREAGLFPNTPHPSIATNTNNSHLQCKIQFPRATASPLDLL